MGQFLFIKDSIFFHYCRAQENSGNLKDPVKDTSYTFQKSLQHGKGTNCSQTVASYYKVIPKCQVAEEMIENDITRKRQVRRKCPLDVIKV